MAKRKPFNSLVASAKNLTDHPLTTSSKQRWQDEAWAYYDASPELRYGIQYLSNAMSRVGLFAATWDESGSHIKALPADHPASIRVQEFGGGPGGQGQLLARAAQNLGVAGIGFLIGITVDGFTDWTLFSADDVQIVVADGFKMTQVRDTGNRTGLYTRGAEWTTIPDDSTVVVMWRPHARHVYEPDSPVRAALSALGELDLLNERIAADAMSRLAGAGVLVVPSEATFPKSSPDDLDDDDFTLTLMEAMTVPIQDRESAAAVVPLVVRVPGEYATGMRHISFATPFDERILDLRTQAISRLAVGLELPNEVLTGMADVNHWSAWQIEESAVKLHVEPLAELICDAITEALVGPLGYDDVFVWYDASELRIRPDRSQSALALYDRLELSPEATRRETGFSEADAPTVEEQTTLLLKKLAIEHPELLPIALKAIAPDAPELPAVGPVNEPPGPAPADTAPSTVNQPGPASPEPSKVQASALTAACDAVVLRALERAGNKLARSHKAGNLGVDASEVHTQLRATTDDLSALFAGAWDRLAVIAARYGVDQDGLNAAVVAYTTNLLLTAQPHDFDALEVALDGL